MPERDVALGSGFARLGLVYLVLLNHAAGLLAYIYRYLIT